MGISLEQYRQRIGANYVRSILKTTQEISQEIKYFKIFSQNSRL